MDREVRTIEGIKARQFAAAKARSTSKVITEQGADMRLDMQVDAKAFHRARERFGADCWKSDEFVNDIKRLHPETVVHRQGRLVFGASGDGGRVRNRLGRVKSRTWYRDGVKHEVTFE